MNRYRLALALALLILVAAFAARAAENSAGDGARASADQAQAATPDAAKVERGRYLVTIAGCNDCHTPWKMGENGPEPDMSRMLSGHPQSVVIEAAPAPAGGPWMANVAGTFTAWAGPWGVSFTRNLTPDNDTGLGTWTEKEFIATIRNGRERGLGRELLPPMPWPNYAKATDEDLAAIYAYLRTIPAISNRVPDPIAPATPPAVKP
jgi:mono/diheme cytochrome c family protein